MFIAHRQQLEKHKNHGFLTDDEDEKTTRTIIPNGSYKTESWFLTENGLFEVLMQSRKPIAKDVALRLLYKFEQQQLKVLF